MNPKITRKQYIEALHIVKQYHSEQLMEGDLLLTLLDEEGATNVLKTRIEELLERIVYSSDAPFLYVEDVTVLYFVVNYRRKDLLMQRNFGDVKADEFEKLLAQRGYKFGMKILE